MGHETSPRRGADDALTNDGQIECIYTINKNTWSTETLYFMTCVGVKAVIMHVSLYSIVKYRVEGTRDYGIDTGTPRPARTCATRPARSVTATPYNSASSDSLPAKPYISVGEGSVVRSHSSHDVSHLSHKYVSTNRISMVTWGRMAVKPWNPGCRYHWVHFVCYRVETSPIKDTTFVTSVLQYRTLVNTNYPV